MSELTQNINVRLSHEKKKRIMDEAFKRGMNMSEYILFLMEDYWQNGSGLSSIQSNSSELFETLEANQRELATTQSVLREANAKINQLLIEKATLHESVNSEKKSIWNEAIETAQKLSQERIERERAQAVREFKDNHLNQLAIKDNQHLQVLTNRLEMYETDLLKHVFNAVSENPSINDLPDMVQVLVYNYYQQFLNPERHVRR